MPQLLKNWLDRQIAPRTGRGHEYGDQPVDDPPPADHPSEQYTAWRATAIYNLGPFVSPPMR